MRGTYWDPLPLQQTITMIERNFHNRDLINEIPFMHFDRVVGGQHTHVSITFSVIRYINLFKVDLFDLAHALQAHMETYNPSVEEMRRCMVDETASICYFTSMPYENRHNVVVAYPKRFLKRISSGNIYGPSYNASDVIDFLESGVI